MAPVKSRLICKFGQNIYNILIAKPLTSNYFAINGVLFTARHVSVCVTNNHVKYCQSAIQHGFHHISTIRSKFLRCYSSSKDNSLLSLSTTKFIEHLKNLNINRCCFVWNDAEKRIVSSHSELKEIEDWLNSDENQFYKNHEAIFLALGMRTNCLQGAFIWNSNRGQACGGIRLVPFDSVQQFMTEGMRLSRRLGVKAALAGLWIGGGKGLISEPADRQHIQPEFRQKLFFDYGDFISSLNGCFIAGIDTGVNTFDLYNVHTRTRWVVSAPTDIGGSGNAAFLLARGLLCAIESALNYLGAGGLNGMKVAVQGAGGIGLAVTSGLLERGAAHVCVTDTSKKTVGDLHDMLMSKAKGRLKVEKVPIGDNTILGSDCDILIPCALGHILTQDTIPEIKAKVICGSANALLKKEEDAKLLAERDITYVLEYIPNRMAFVNAAYENYGRLYTDPAIERHFYKDWEHSIYCLTHKTLEMSSNSDMSVIDAAYHLANQYCQQKHPLWPDRTKAIIESLVAGAWHNGLDFWRKRRNFAKADDWS